MRLSSIRGLTGDGAAAEAMRQIDPDLVAAYPITPQTEIVERFAQFAADGRVHTEFVTVESEHSALSACCGGAAAGGRVMTCTASQGLALMHEILYIAAANRLPIVMTTVNRTLSAPININADHSDTMGSRDCGWIQLYCLDAQEVYDLTIQAVRISEDLDVMLPVMVAMDGFLVSHDMERVELMDDGDVKAFVGTHEPTITLLDDDNPISIGAFVGPEYFFEHKIAQVRSLEASLHVIESVGAKFGERTGRFYGTMETYFLDDADVAFVALGSAAGNVRVAVDEMRAKGIKSGLLRIRSYRPFPMEQIKQALRNAKSVAVLDRAVSPGAPGAPLFSDVCTTLFGLENGPRLISVVYGLGGRDITPEMLLPVGDRLMDLANGKSTPMRQYLGLRE
jgi:pyruvate ferredoxin oxidoreductase alpha subunit